MPDVTQLLESVVAGDRRAASDLLPLVYQELRNLAVAHMARERVGHTLSATALVHEAYLRLIGDQHFDGRRHFIAAATEAMRRVLIDRARRAGRQKYGAGCKKVELDDIARQVDEDPHLLLSLDEALARLSAEDSIAADVAKLRLIAGLSIDEAATALGMSRATAHRNWTYARAWLRDALADYL